MELIYVVHVRMTGCSGNVIHFVDSAYRTKENALYACDKMNELNQNDSNFLAYVTGTIMLKD